MSTDHVSASCIDKPAARIEKEESVLGTILILDGQQRNVISCVRSLARAGHSIAVGAHSPDALCFGSRYIKKRWLYPDPNKDPKLFLDALVAEVQSNHYDLVLPFIDVTTRIIVEAQQEIGEYVPLLVPTEKGFRIAVNKAYTIQMAQKINIPIPRTSYPGSLEEAIVDARNIGYPVVIKPRMSSGSRGLKIVSCEKELIHHFPRIHNDYPDPIIQEFIPERDAVGFVAVYDKNSVIKAFSQHRRIHQYPLSGGPSTLRETIYDERLLKYGTALLDELKWIGPAMVEFRVDDRDCIPKLMEINPRLWGSIALHIAAGVNIPELIFQGANCILTNNVFSYRIGTRAKWLLPGEILYFITNLRRGNLKLDALKWWGEDMVLDIGSWEDPFPVLIMIKNSFKSLFKWKAIKHVILRA